MHQLHEPRQVHEVDVELIYRASFEYLLHGRTAEFGESAAASDWGAPNMTFEMIPA
jgi:hypothetical protein